MLPVRQRVLLGSFPALRSQRRQASRRVLRMDAGLPAGGHVPNRGDHLGVDCFLEHISAGARREGLAHIARVVLHREHEHLQIRLLVQQLSGCLRARSARASSRPSGSRRASRSGPRGQPRARSPPRRPSPCLPRRRSASAGRSAARHGRRRAGSQSAAAPHHSDGLARQHADRTRIKQPRARVDARRARRARRAARDLRVSRDRDAIAAMRGEHERGLPGVLRGGGSLEEHRLDVAGYHTTLRASHCFGGQSRSARSRARPGRTRLCDPRRCWQFQMIEQLMSSRNRRGRPPLTDPQQALVSVAGIPHRPWTTMVRTFPKAARRANALDDLRARVDDHFLGMGAVPLRPSSCREEGPQRPRPVDRRRGTPVRASLVAKGRRWTTSSPWSGI